MAMSDGPTGKFVPISNDSSLPSLKRPVVRFLDALSGMFIFSGLLAWIWLADWRWAATGVLLAAIVWTCVTASDTAKVRK